MNDEPSERYDFNGNRVTGCRPIDWENDLVPIELWREQQNEIRRLQELTEGGSREG